MTKFLCLLSIISFNQIICNLKSTFSKIVIAQDLSIDSHSIYYKFPILYKIDQLELSNSYTELTKILDSIYNITSSDEKEYFRLRRLYTNIIISKDFKNHERLGFKIDTTNTTLAQYTCFYLAKSYSYFNLYDSAKHYFEIFNNYYTENSKSFDPIKRNYLFSYSKLLTSEENYQKADSISIMLLNYEAKNPNPDSLFQSNIHYLLGNIKRQMSENVLSEYHLRKAIQFDLNNPNKILKSKILADLSILLISSNLLDESKSVIDSALNIAYNSNDTGGITRCLFIKAILLSILGNYKESHKLFLKELDFPKEYYSESEIQIRIIQNAINAKFTKVADEYYNKVFHSLNQFKSAKKAYLKSIESDYFLYKQNYYSALKCINQSLELIEPKFISKVINNPPPTLVTLIDDIALFYLGKKAKLFFTLYSTTKNINYLNYSINHYLYIDSLFALNCRFKDDGDEIHAMDVLNQIYFDAIKTLNIAYKLNNSYKYLEQINFFTERIRSKRFYRSITSSNIINSTQNIKLKKLLSTEDSINKIINTTAFNNIELDNLINNRDRIYSEIKTSFPNEYFDLFNQICPSIKDISSWCSKENFKIIHILLNDEKDIFVIKYSKFGLKINFYKSSDSLLHYLKNLRENPFDSIAKSKISVFRDGDDSQENYILIPDASISNYPLHLIFSNAPENETYYSSNMVFYSFTLKSLINVSPLKIITRKYLNMLSVCNADIGDFDLPYTYLESKYLEFSFKNNFKSLRGNNSTYYNFEKNISGVDILHLGMHGKYGISSKENSGIFFKDGFVSINKILNLKQDLPHTILLNSCESSLGTIIPGEGIINFSRIFALKGSHLIVSFNNKLNDKLSYNILKKLFNNDKINPKVYNPNMFVYIN